MAFLEARNLSVYFPIYKGVFRRVVGQVKAVREVSFQLSKGQVLSIIGESGSGKTTIGNAILGLYPPTTGHIIFENQNIRNLWFKGQIQTVFQNPYSSLNPRLNILNIVSEPLDHMAEKLTLKQKYERVVEILETVGLEPDSVYRYPHQFSGGQRQRISIARALISKPKLIILDEPVSSLDVSIRAQILNLLTELKQKKGLSYIFISHDLATVRFLSNHILIIYRGRVMEYGSRKAIFERPAQPYTHLLLRSARDIIVPKNQAKSNPRAIESTQDGCPFIPRCPYATSECSQSFPEPTYIEEGHYVHCYHPILS